MTTTTTADPNPAPPTNDADHEAATIEHLRAEYRERTHP